MSHTPHVAPSLFDLAPVRSMEDRAVDHAYALLRGDSVPTNPPGLQLSSRQRVLLRELADRRTPQRAISAAELARRGDCDDRTVRAEVYELRKAFGVQIGSSRHTKDSGYYLITREEDRRSFVAQYLNQIKSEVALLDAMFDRATLLEIAGQHKFNLNDPLATPVPTEETHHAA